MKKTINWKTNVIIGAIIGLIMSIILASQPKEMKLTIAVPEEPTYYEETTNNDELEEAYALYEQGLVSKEYIQELEFNSRQTVWFGFTECE